MLKQKRVLTKAMSTDTLVRAMMTGKFNMRPTEESFMIKEKNRASRKRNKKASSPTATDT